METTGLANLAAFSALSRGENSRPAELSSTDNSFLNGLLSAFTRHEQQPLQPQAVYAGQEKNFEFLLREEKVPHKGFKYRTLDDARADLEKILRELGGGEK